MVGAVASSTSHDDVTAAYEGTCTVTTRATSRQIGARRENTSTVLLLPLSGVLDNAVGDSAHKCSMSGIGFSRRRAARRFRQGANPSPKGRLSRVSDAKHTILARSWGIDKPR